MISCIIRSFNIERSVSYIRCIGGLMLLATTVDAVAGEIAGLPSNTPPNLARPLEFSFSNDFLGRGGTVDDFRTQQFIISGTIQDRWDVTVDHSILTLVDGDAPGRADQVSATLGYRLLDNVTDTTAARLTAGAGVRAYGDFGGERMQNGFHRLVQSGVEVVPYTDLDRVDGVAWVDAQRHVLIKGTRSSDDWRWGYWLRGSALWASDGQMDTAAGVYGVAGKGSVDLWLGLRHDWRSGYAEPVLAETAAAEEDLAAVFGLRWGPIVFETVQQFDNEASYGQVRLLATGFGEERASSEQSRFVFDVGVTVPDVHANLTGRWRAAWLNRGDVIWRRSLFFTAGFGEPQHDDDPMIYLRAIQAGMGLEWERRLEAADGWASLYASTGIGWREERVFGDKDRQGQQSDTIGRAMAMGRLGLRFNAAELIRNYNVRIQLGLAGWIPFSDAQVTMEGETFDVQKPTLAISLGLTLGRFSD